MARVKHDAALEAAFAVEEERAIRLGAIARLAALPIVAVWIAIENPFPAGLFYEGAILAFAAISWVSLSLLRRGRFGSVHRYLFPALDFILLGLLVFLPNPFDRSWHPAALRLRFGNEVYFFLLLLSPVFAYSPRLVLWTGFVAAVVWSVGSGFIVMTPGSVAFPPSDAFEALPSAAKLRIASDPHTVWLGAWGRLVVVMMLFSSTLATAVWRFRRIVAKQAQSERERSNLSRYFSPNMVEQLANADQALGATRTQNVAVLFADVVGFTAMSAKQTPEASIEFLRELNRRLADAVFRFGGTLDKYLGDGVMATFGTPHTTPEDALHALQCAQSMLQEIDEWNRQRSTSEPVRLSVGVHYGPVVLGDIGSARHLEFAVIGDTVNVASRLQEMTREFGVRILTTAEVLAAAGSMAPSGFAGLGAHSLRGRDGEMQLFGYR